MIPTNRNSCDGFVSIVRLKKGVVVNIDATTDAIQKSIEQAKNSFEGKIKNVFVGIAGNHKN